MPYITADDIVAMYGEDILVKVADNDRDGVPDAPVVARGIASADAIIDGYLSLQYTLPLKNVPGIVAECAIDIAIYKMALKRAQRTDEMRQRYEDALQMLTGISKGTVGLGLTDAQLADNGDAEDTKLKKGRSLSSYLS